MHKSTLLHLAYKKLRWTLFLKQSALGMLTVNKEFVILSNPVIEVACQTIQKALSQHRNLVIIGDCHVEYLGRARSILELGERIILIKSDGAILVHRPINSEPVNWQPSGCVFKTTLINGVLVLKAIKRKPVESLTVYFTQLKCIVAAKLLDIGNFNLHVSEKELQKAVLAEPKLLLPDLKYIAYEKKIEPGFVDIYGLDSKNRLIVAELKRVKAGKAAVLQLAKYVEYVKRTTTLQVRGILVAPKTTKSVLMLLSTLGLEFVSIDLEKCAQIIAKRHDKKMIEFLN